MAQETISLLQDSIVILQGFIVKPACLGNFHIEETSPQGRVPLDKLQIIRREKNQIQRTIVLLWRNGSTISLGLFAGPFPFLDPFDKEPIFPIAVTVSHFCRTISLTKFHQFLIMTAAKRKPHRRIIEPLQKIGLALGIAAIDDRQVMG